MSKQAPIIYWLRQDLRLSDHPGLTAALASGRPVLPVYILDEAPDVRLLGGASRWWLHHSITALSKQLPLVLRRGVAEHVLDELIKEVGADTLMWSRCYEPYAIARDTALKKKYTAAGLKVESHNSALLFEPWELKTKTGGPYQVFTPFWKACRAVAEIAKPLPKPKGEYASSASDKLVGWNLLPTKPDWAKGFDWQPGEAGAQALLTSFLDGPVNGYKEDRNLPGSRTTSRLSPHLHFGEISPRLIWHTVHAAVAAGKVASENDSDHFLSEIGWREFSHHLLYHFPKLPSEPLNKKFLAFPWDDNDQALQLWQRGLTGYPIVDAGMRELWQTGWMHNRVRMIAASFLVKDLLIPWQRGEQWFWDTLVDADLANNVASWQWVAGCGADAAPYFRIFNPILQGEKFDPAGSYIRRYVPEIAGLPDKWLHRPFEAPQDVLQAAGIKLGTTYPRPLVDHHSARDRALAAYAALKES
jgi:deoxyribodipyrimidine photo-lyase